MVAIWKYPVRGVERFTLAMPRGAQVLTVQAQRGEAQLWALVDTDQPKEERWFLLAGTGHELRHKPGRYLGTFQVEDGLLIFHVFEVAAP